VKKRSSKAVPEHPSERPERYRSRRSEKHIAPTGNRRSAASSAFRPKSVAVSHRQVCPCRPFASWRAPQGWRIVAPSAGVDLDMQRPAHRRFASRFIFTRRPPVKKSDIPASKLLTSVSLGSAFVVGRKAKQPVRQHRRTLRRRSRSRAVKRSPRRIAPGMQTALRDFEV